MVVLDSWTLLAYLKDEPSAGRIERAWLSSGAAVSAINLGEVLYMRIRGRGETDAAADVNLIRSQCTVIDPDWALTAAAARIKANGGLAYADAFCVATAEHLGVPVLTGDPEIIGLSERFACDVVDLRQSEK